MGFSWDFGHEIGKKQERAGNLRISGKSGKIGKSKESKRPALNVEKILNFGEKSMENRKKQGFEGFFKGKTKFQGVQGTKSRVFDDFGV